LHAGRLAHDLQAMLTLDLRHAQSRGPGGQPATPLLALAGTEDGVVPQDLTRSALPGDCIEWLPGGGHLLPLQAADWCAARIAAFLGNLGLAPGSPAGHAASQAPQAPQASQASQAPQASQVPQAVGARPERPADVAARFSTAAVSYEGHASVQHGIASRLAARIATLDLPRRPRILEIGCGTGALTQRLGTRFADADWTITDLSPAMVRTARRALTLGGVSRYRVMDGEDPDLDEEPADFDLICSSMAVQWFGDPVRGLERLAARLAPGGHLAVALPVQGTFAEWQRAHEQLGLRARTLRFLDPAALHPGGDDVQARTEVECVIDECGSARTFLRGLRRIGATAAQPGTRPLSAAQLRRVCTEFERAGARCSYRIAYCLWRRQDAAPMGISI
jgi:malonyl-CoA O-methyltransferase